MGGETKHNQQLQLPKHTYPNHLKAYQLTLQLNEDLVAGSMNHHYLVRTTPQSFLTLVHDTNITKPKMKIKSYNDDVILNLMKWIMLVCDEFHLEKGAESTSIKIFRCLVT